MTNIYAHLEKLEDVVTTLSWDMLLDEEKSWYEAQWSNWKVNIQPDTVGLELEDKILYFYCIDDTKQFGAYFRMPYIEFYEYYKKIDGEFNKVNKAIANAIGCMLISNMELLVFDEDEIFGIE